MRKLVAALACRISGSRLYGKPLQNLDVDGDVSILDHLVRLIRTFQCIDAVTLGIAKGHENSPFVEFAESRGIEYITGDENDVLERLIACGTKAQATDVFRVTTESPFVYYDMVDDAWQRHVEGGNDVTTVDGLPEGSHFEIYTLDALVTSHEHGDVRHRSEFCSLYVREHRDDFQVEVMPVPAEVARLDLRLTVDNPEDLVLCRRVYAHLKEKAPRLPLRDIVRFLDSQPELQRLVARYVVSERIW